jgi:DNA-binding NarL/FixJ family response regulator
MSSATATTRSGQVARRRRPTRVAIIDSNPVLRLGVRAAIHVVTDLVLVAEIGAADATESSISAARPDITLIELGLIRTSAGTAVWRWLGRDATAQVIIYADRFDHDTIAYALSRGARGFLPKTASPRDLVRAVHATVTGNCPVDPAVASAMLRSMTPTTTAGAEPLTDTTTIGPPATPSLTAREKDVIRLIASGLTDGESALRLSIAETTVRYHVRNIRRKLGVSRRAHAVYEATRIGLI